MAVGSNFKLVRDAFCRNLAENLRRLNVEIKATTPKGDWLQVCCPFCSDSNGSASISVNTGHLVCHQCSAKEDVFTWVGKAIGIETVWLQCQTIAKIAGVAVEGLPGGKPSRLFRVVPELTEELLQEFQQRLFEDPDEELSREFLRRRGLWKPTELEAFPIGSVGGKIVFGQHNHQGKLLKRCRVFDPFPMNGSAKWTWNKVRQQTGKTVGFWPLIPRMIEADPDAKLLVCEGEWDLLAAVLKLRIMDHGWIATTWTGGGGSGIPVDAIPEFMQGREAHLCYDNDVWQGIGEDMAPSDKQKAEMRQRKKAFVEITGPSFAANQCQVYLRAVTISPLTQFGGDLRDMIDAGLQSLDELPKNRLDECRRSLLTAKKVAFEEVHKHLNEYVEFRCQVAGVGDEVAIKMDRAAVRCQKGQYIYCKNCGLDDVAPNGVLDFTDKQDQLAIVMTSGDLPRATMERVVGKPSVCKQWSLIPIESSDGSRWTAMAREDDSKENSRTVEVISNSMPTLSGELLVRGWLYISSNGLTPVLMCDHLEAADKMSLPIGPHLTDIWMQMPNSSSDPAELDGYLDRWAEDVANHTTHIYGRRDMHVAIGLTMHSSLWLDVMGARRRGWLDICLMGATRTGKSAAVRAYLKALQMGQLITPMGNFSRPGLTLGTVQMNGQLKMKPGSFPRNHAKMLAIDESHLMVQDNSGGGGLFPMLQAARDIGKVEAAKVSGNQTLNAAVRLIAIANWIGGSKLHYATPAQHLLALYGTPESLARLDFGLPIDEIETGMGPSDVPQWWTPERQRVLAVRAWQLPPELIIFEEEAVEFAQGLCRLEWKDKYSEELPLFTEKEKVYSLLRIATAVANMLVSSKDSDATTCLVRLVHVQWAARWLEHTWKQLEYETVSRHSKKAFAPTNVWRIEALLTVGLGLTDPTAVNFTIGRFFGVLSREELKAVTGLDHNKFEAWITTLVRAGALEVMKPTGYSSQIGLRFTRGAIAIIQHLVVLADSAPEAWGGRYNRISTWSTGGSGLIKAAPDNLLPIDAPVELHLNAIRQRRFDE